ncbi:Uncharacterised protein [Serratia entomophila]|jgi:hypothetical protein|nr:Uncharacterised protein [Serratia entomophila]CAI1062986.1 Uncharacterised protein [Serratia entomophila]CAI1071901.1 Uncharacterised protein [Serratia entomophila]CAI1076729.1 Uncharacterised protein [Serratia entomophila]CAI1079214.1 Uncharacterised protein [Serratia entomophila]
MKNKTFLPDSPLEEVSLRPAADYDVICCQRAAVRAIV